jgi:mannose-6-phosphate isomerase-like protein (cupin superfamily)
MDDLLTRGKYPAPVNRGAIAMAWRAQGYSCDLFVDPPGRAWIDFVHASNELLAVAEGRLEITIGDAIFVAEPGDEIFIPRGARHSVRNVYSSSTRWLYGYDRPSA